MKSKKEIFVKDDVNFLEYPTFILDEHLKSLKTYKITKEFGEFILSVSDATDRLPDKRDKTVLLVLLSHVFRENPLSLEVVTTRFKLAKEIYGVKPSQSNYQILERSLDRLTTLTIKFKGLFFDGENYISKVFHVIESYEIKNDGSLRVRFNKDYIEQLKLTGYFKMVNVTEFLALKSATAARLYELLIKNFKNRKSWEISAVKLAEKMALGIKYPSHIAREIMKATEEINDKTLLKFTVKFDKQRKVLVFQDRTRELKKEFDKLIDSFKGSEAIINGEKGFVRKNGTLFIYKDKKLIRKREAFKLYLQRKLNLKKVR